MESTESGGGRSYRCFLVRCRLEEGGLPGSGQPAWRFTVEQIRPDAARRSFASIRDVAAYLEAELESSGKQVVTNI
jgi:hypothetical protein